MKRTAKLVKQAHPLRANSKRLERVQRFDAEAQLALIASKYSRSLINEFYNSWEEVLD